MAGLGIAAQAIITKGLSCGVATKAGLITSRFSLYCVVEAPPIPPVIPPGGGGSVPGPAPSINIPIQPYTYPLIPQIPIKIIITFFGRTMEHNYLVSRKRGDIIITILNLVNTIHDRIKITVSNVRTIFGITMTTVSVSNLRKIPSRITSFVKNLRRDD